jgi:hypothetical protein
MREEEERLDVITATPRRKVDMSSKKASGYLYDIHTITGPRPSQITESEYYHSTQGDMNVYP